MISSRAGGVGCQISQLDLNHNNLFYPLSDSDQCKISKPVFMTNTADVKLEGISPLDPL